MCICSRVYNSKDSIQDKKDVIYEEVIDFM